MVEVTLIAPATQVQTVGAGGQQAQNATQTGSLSATYLSPGALVSGIIIGRDSGGSYLLKAEQGTFTLHSNVPLTYNSDVLIRVDTSTGSNAAARIISVNGQAFSAYSEPAAQETDSISPSLLAKAGSQPVTTNAASAENHPPSPPKAVTVQAVTVPAPPSSGTSATQPLQVPIQQGTRVTLEIPVNVAGNATAASANATQTSASTPSNMPAATVPAAPASGQTAAIPQAQPQPSATPVTPPQSAPAATVAQATPANVAKLVVAQPQALEQEASHHSNFFANTAPANPVSTGSLPTQAAQNALYAAYAKSVVPGANTPSPGQAQNITLTATLLPPNEDGTLTLLTPQGSIYVKPEALATAPVLNTAIPVNITLPLHAILPTQPQTTDPQDSMPSTLKDIITLLQNKAPAVASELLARLPAIGTDFLSASVAFAASLLQGNARKILGDNVLDVLRDGAGGKLLERFTASTSAMAQALNQSSAGADNTGTPNWQAMVLPYLYQGALQEARLYVKRDSSRKGKDGKKNAADTRFVIEVTFSDLGEMQLDGLVTPKERSTVFNLVVRTQAPFLPDEKQDIMRIYSHTAELTGFTGNIEFQVTQDFPVKPLAEMSLMPQHSPIIA